MSLRLGQENLKARVFKATDVLAFNGSNVVVVHAGGMSTVNCAPLLRREPRRERDIGIWI